MRKTLPPKEKWSKAFLGAYRKGQEAALARKSLSANPYAYDDYGNAPGGVTFARGFHRRWREGHESVSEKE